MNRIIIAAIGLSVGFLLTLTFLQRAWPHDLDCAGEAVKTEVKQQCCGLDDLHVLKPEDIHYLDSGDVEVTQEGERHVFTAKEVMPGACNYVWYKRYSNCSYEAKSCDGSSHISWFCLQLSLGF